MVFLLSDVFRWAGEQIAAVQLIGPVPVQEATAPRSGY
jgi:hypothetical protein